MIWLAAAVDGEPLVATGRAAATLHARAVIDGVRALAAPLGVRAVVAIERRADDARAALRACAPDLPIMIVPDVAGCREARWLAARCGDDDARVVFAETLVPGEPLLTLAGAVAAPGVRRAPAGVTVEQLVELAGGSTCGPAWLAVDGTLAPRALDRDLPPPPGTRAVIVLPGAAELARRVRGDRRAVDPSDPLGVDRAWLGMAAPARGVPADLLSLALVAARLGLPAEGLSL